MIINFKLEDYYEVCDQYEDVFEQEDVVDVFNGEDCLVVRTRRIVIPALHASFREAEWLATDPDADDEEWETQSSVIVRYEENERDPAQFISYATCDLTYFAVELGSALEIAFDDISQLDC